ncbi:MAG: hypothetical protein ACYTET_02805 [Planctomycetota bacterium]
MNRKRLSIWIMALLISTTTLAIDFMGPPRASLDKQQFKLGFTYHYSENDLEVASGSLDNVDVSRYYAILGYGLADWAEVYAILGVADVEQDDIGFSSSVEAAYGWGFKATVHETEKLDWGVITQMSWFKVDDSASVNRRFGDYTFTGSGSVDMDAYELQIAFGPTMKFEKWQLYGGGFYYLLDGDLDAKGSFTLNGNPIAAGKVSADLDEDSNVGAFAGALFHLPGNLDANAEVAATGDAWGIGGNLTWKF